MALLVVCSSFISILMVLFVAGFCRYAVIVVVRGKDEMPGPCRKFLVNLVFCLQVKPWVPLCIPRSKAAVAYRGVACIVEFLTSTSRAGFLAFSTLTV